MTQPNPFSMANSLEHLVNPKVITVSGNYEVAVDIANVDTYYGRQLGGPTSSQEIQQAYIRQIGTTGISGQAYFSQIGTTGSSGQAFFNNIGSLTSRGNGYFNTIYWNNLVPFPSGGSGASGTTFFAGPGISIAQNNSGATFSANLQGIQGINVTTPVSGPVTIGYNAPSFIGSTGINVSLSGNTYRFSSTLGISGSQYIGVQQTGNTYTISYLGSQGGSGTISGISGSYAVFGASGIESSTVLTSTNIVGPTGRVMLYSPQGPTYNNLLTYADSAFPRIITPFVESRYSNGILSLVPFTNQNFIESTGINAKALPLNISGGVGSPNLTNFDIPQGKVTINPGNSYPSGVANVFSGSSIGTTFLAGGTYSVYLYGGGGAGLSGFAGGAGGFVKINGITGGSTIAFEQLTNANGGGVGIRLNVNGSSVAVAPGGGAGGTGGRGAAYGEPGGSYNGQGFSAKDSTPGPGAGGSGGVYTNFQTNGLTGYVYRFGITGATAQSGIFNNVQVTYGLTGDVASGTRILAYSNGTIVNDNNSLLFPGFSTYYFPPGTTLSIQTDGITFDNSLYSFAGVTAGLINLSNINSSSLTGATFSRQAFGGTASIEGSTFQFLNGYVGGTFTGDGSGLHQILVGATFTTGLTGLTLRAQAGRIVDSNISGGIQMDFPTALTFTLSRSLGSVIAPTLKITDPIGIAGNSIIQVQYQNTISRGQDGSSVNLPGINGGFFGGGNGDYGGGGGTGGGGGGAGGVYIAPAYSGITGAGSGSIPIGNTYNFNGQYGFGGSGTPGGLPYYVIEKIDATLQPDVLQVNGNESVSGNLNVNGNEIINGNLNVNGSSVVGTSSGAIISRSYGSPSQNTGPTEIVTHDIGFNSGNVVGNANSGTDSIRLRSVLGSGAFSGDGLAFVIATVTGSNNWTPAERFRVTSGSGSTPASNAPVGGYPPGSVVVGGINGPSASNLYVTGTLFINQPGSGGVEAAVFSNFGGSGGGLRRIQIFNDQAIGPMFAFTSNLTAQPDQGGIFAFTRNLTAGNFNMDRPLNVQGTITGTDLIATSDRRLKENIQTVDSALDKVMKLRGVYFTKKDSNKRNLGVIAQEVEEIIPEVVFTDDSPEQMKSVAYGNIIGLLIEALKEQQIQIDELRRNTR